MVVGGKTANAAIIGKFNTSNGDLLNASRIDITTGYRHLVIKEPKIFGYTAAGWFHIINSADLSLNTSNSLSLPVYSGDLINDTSYVISSYDKILIVNYPSTITW